MHLIRAGDLAPKALTIRARPLAGDPAEVASVDVHVAGPSSFVQWIDLVPTVQAVAGVDRIVVSRPFEAGDVPAEGLYRFRLYGRNAGGDIVFTASGAFDVYPHDGLEWPS